MSLTFSMFLPSCLAGARSMLFHKKIWGGLGVLHLGEQYGDSLVLSEKVGRGNTLPTTELTRFPYVDFYREACIPSALWGVTLSVQNWAGAPEGGSGIL